MTKAWPMSISPRPSAGTLGTRHSFHCKVEKIITARLVSMTNASFTVSQAIMYATINPRKAAITP